MNKYTIELTEEQLRDLAFMSEIMARCHIGQIDEIARVVDKFRMKDETHKVLKKDLFPELDLHGSYAIHSNHVPEVARRLWDFYQVARHRLAHDSLKPGEKRGFTVNFDEPLKISQSDLVKIKREGIKDV